MFFAAFGGCGGADGRLAGAEGADVGRACAVGAGVEGSCIGTVCVGMACAGVCIGETCVGGIVVGGGKAPVCGIDKGDCRCVGPGGASAVDELFGVEWYPITGMESPP